MSARLKLKYYPDIKEEGLEQIVDYLDTLGLSSGYLVIFEIRDTKKINWEKRIKWSQELLNGKEITIVEM